MQCLYYERNLLCGKKAFDLETHKFEFGMLQTFSTVNSATTCTVRSIKDDDFVLDKKNHGTFYTTEALSFWQKAKCAKSLRVAGLRCVATVYEASRGLGQCSSPQVATWNKLSTQDTKTAATFYNPP